MASIGARVCPLWLRLVRLSNRTVHSSLRAPDAYAVSCAVNGCLNYVPNGFRAGGCFIALGWGQLCRIAFAIAATDAPNRHAAGKKKATPIRSVSSAPCVT